MKQLHTQLTGENLARFKNINEKIQMARRRASLGDALDLRGHEDILSFPSDPELECGYLTVNMSSYYSEELPTDPAEDRQVLDVHRKAEFGFGYRDIRDETSDGKLDELETNTKDGKNKLSRTTESSQSKITQRGTITSAEETREPENVRSGEINMRLYDKISPEEEQKIYEEICYRYGKESGRRYLLIRSMSAPEKNIEEWTSTEQKLSKSHVYSNAMMECPEPETKHEGNICPGISEDVTNKMQTLVEVLPFCSTERVPVQKRWKDVLTRKPDRSIQKMQHMSVKGESDLSIFSSEEKSDHTPCLCGTLHCDCDLTKTKCEVPKIKKKCYMGEHETDEINNYLITCRESLQNKQNQDRRVTILQQHAVNVANRTTRESLYLQAAHDQAENELVTCLMKVMPPQGQEVSDTGFHHVQELANVIAEHKMINEHEWRVWRYSHAKMENLENSEDVDSLDSDIIESATSDDELSDLEITVSKGLQPSRIPYFKETFELANRLFRRINAKMDKLVSKNHDKRKMAEKKPRTVLLKEKFLLLRNDNRLFNQICKKLESSKYYSKHLIPFSERKKRKRDRANIMKVELNRTQRRRQFIEGLQLGKKYRKPKRSFLFTEKENYRGFSPRKQKFLKMTGDVKFRKCNLVGSELSGRQLTQKVIHNNYRLIRRMFDDQLERNRESLWDPGMKARMKQYLGVFKEEQNISSQDEKYEDEVEDDASDIPFDTNQRRPKKDEQKIQTSQPYSWSYCSKSSGNAAETFASMIRSLRSEAKSQAILGSESLHNVSKPLRAQETVSSFRTTTVQSSGLTSNRRPIITGQVSSGLRPSLGRPRRVPFSKTDAPGNVSSTGISDTDPSVPQKSPTPPGKRYVKSIKTQPNPTQSIKTNRTNLSQKHLSWKSSKTLG